jgi:hypothetical protein
VGEDVRPSGLSQHEEHQDKDQPQKVNIYRAHPFVLGGLLKRGFEARGHKEVSQKS